MVNWVKQRSRLQLLLAFCFCIMVGASMALIIGRTQPAQEFWIIYGGNTDPGNGQGDGAARQQMIAGGWTIPENSFQVTWRADIGSGTVSASNDAMSAGKEAVNRFCAGKRCIIAGFSLGASPALQLARETGQPADQTYIFGGPQASTGIWHSQFQDNPMVEPWVTHMGQLNPDRLAPAGVHNYYHSRDPYNNAAPQCQGPGLFALTLAEHRIVTRVEADASHRWTGPDGVLMFEVGYTGPFGLPASGSDPSQPWAGCIANDWKATVNSPGPQTNPDQPGIPGGSPIPSQEGNLPSVLPSAPAIPGVPTP